MEKIKKHIGFKFLWALLLPALMWLFTNAVVNNHIHIQQDGSVAQHAHPFKKADDSSPYAKHKHSKAEYLLFSGNHLLNTLTVADYHIEFIPDVHQMEYASLELHGVFLRGYTHGLRAPPALV